MLPIFLVTNLKLGSVSNEMSCNETYYSTCVEFKCCVLCGTANKFVCGTIVEAFSFEITQCTVCCILLLSPQFSSYTNFFGINKNLFPLKLQSTQNQLLPLDSAVPLEQERIVGEQQVVEAPVLLPSNYSFIYFLLI